MKSVLSCENLTCHRPSWNGAGPSRIVDVSASFAPGGLYGFCGPDGCGKGLLLNVLGLLEPPDSGCIRVAGRPLPAAGNDEFCQLRNEVFGFLFDHSFLLPSFSVAENVAMPLFRICGGDARAARARTLEMLEFCGITAHESTLAGRLDHATQRRAALARALVHQPAILVALSSHDGGDMVALARRAAREMPLCVLWAGEETALSRHADHLTFMRDGHPVAPAAS